MNNYNPYSGFQDLSQGPSQGVITNPLFASQPQPTNVMADEKPKESGNLWSTIGGIALPVLGALLAPETGGLSLLGGLAGGAALSGVGGAAGKAIDNAVAGQNPFQENTLEEGLTSGVGALAGGALAKGAGALAKGVIKPVADKGAVSLLEGQGKGALDKETANYLYKNGVTNLGHMGDIAPLITGKTGAYSNAVNDALYDAAKNGTRIDLSSLAAQGKGLPGDTVLNAVRSAGISGDSGAVKSIQDLIQGQLEKYNQSGLVKVPLKKGGVMTNFNNGVLNAQHPLDAFNMTQELDSTAAKWLKSSSPNIQAQGKALQNISGTIKDALYGEGTSIGNSGISDAIRQKAVERLAPLKEINPQYYEAKVAELLGNDTTPRLETIAQLRSAQRPEVLANQALDMATQAANTSGGTNVGELLKVGAPVAGMSAGGPAGLAAGLVAPKILGSNAANVAGTTTLGKLSDVIGSDKAQKVMETLGKVAGVTAANVPGMGAQPTNQSLLSTIGSNGEQNGVTNMNPQQSQLSTILNAMEAQSILAPELNPNSTALLSAYAPQLQKNQVLKQAIASLPQQFGNAGGAQGLGGIGSVLSSLIPGTAANAYQGTANSLSAQLAQALGITPEAAQNLLPSLLQNEQTAGQRQNVLGSLVSALPS